MRPNIIPGATFPNYELPDHTGTLRKLSELQGENLMVLVISRGHYCPKDIHQHRLLVAWAPECNVSYTRIVTLSTDNLLQANDMRDGLGASWPFLCDPSRQVQRDLDIAEYTDPEHNPMIPYTLILEPGLVVYKVYNGYWYWGRPSIEELRADLRQITRKLMPDWDISDPKLRAAWSRGERNQFFPYGQRFSDVYFVKEQ